MGRRCVDYDKNTFREVRLKRKKGVWTLRHGAY